MSATSNFQGCYSPLTFDMSNIDKVKGLYIFTICVNFILIILILLLNGPLFTSLRQAACNSQALHRKQLSKLLVIFAFWNLARGTLVDPSFMVGTAGVIDHVFSFSCKFGKFTFIANSTLSTMAFSTLTAIAAERYYKVYGNDRIRSTRVIVIIQVVGVLGAVSAVLAGTRSKSAQFTVDLVLSIIFTVVAAFVFVHCKNTVHGRLHNWRAIIHSNLLKLQKSIDAMLCVLVIFALTHLPLLTLATAMASEEDEEGYVHLMRIECLWILADSFCSAVTPVIIMWKMKKVRKGFMRHFHRMVNRFICIS